MFIFDDDNSGVRTYANHAACYSHSYRMCPVAMEQGRGNWALVIWH